ncbi:MAG: carbohydrate kinase family protein [Anaerolineales bacterium]|nr:carbohydrate kinase family protein [Anaerolineales bacterium]
MEESEERGSVLVIGAAGLDMVGRLSGESEEGTSTPARIRVGFGGVARNVAENLARLSQPCSLLSAVGEDVSGRALVGVLTEAGVDVSALRILPGQTTGAYLAVIDSQGRLRTALDDMAVLRAITPESLKEAEPLFRSARMVFLDANLSNDAIAEVFRMAQAAGVPLSADPTSRHLAARLAPYLNRLQLITPNVLEAEILLGRRIPPGDPADAVLAAQELSARGVCIALISLAEFGVAYATRERRGHFPALRTTIVDPTGAGDALTAAVLFAILNDIPLDEAVRLGISAASLTLRSRQTVVPDLSLERLYEEIM